MAHMPAAETHDYSNHVSIFILSLKFLLADSFQKVMQCSWHCVFALLSRCSITHK